MDAPWFQDLTDLPGARHAYLPTLAETDYPQNQFGDLANASSGIVSAFESFAASRDRLPYELNLADYAPVAAARKIEEGVTALAKEAEKTIRRCESVVEGKAKEASDLRAKLTGLDSAPVDAAAIVASLTSMPPARRIAQLHDIAKQITEGQNVAHGRAFLVAALKANSHLGLVSEHDRIFLTRVVGQNANPSEWERMERMEQGVAVVREAAARARELISNPSRRDDDRRARFVRS